MGKDQVMIQPFIKSVDKHGEAAAVFIGGKFSHAFNKGPFLEVGGTLMGGNNTYTEVINNLQLTDKQLDVAHKCCQAVKEIIKEKGLLDTEKALLFERYDTISDDNGNPILLEAELFDPNLNLSLCAESPDRFVDHMLS